MKHFYQYLLLTLTLFFASACVTEKKKDDVKGFKLFMQNLTSKYNGYFNAKVLYEEAVDKLNAQHQDNYNKVIDIYPYASVENSTAVSPDLDKAIEKLAVVITYHRPSHWTDDSYLLIGKSQFIKHEYESAQETFEYLTEVYNPNLKKNMSKKEKQEAAEEARKTAKKERDAKAKEARQERERKTEERKKAAEETKKQRAKEEEEKRKAKEAELKEAERLKEEQKKKEKEDLEKRNQSRKLTAEEAAKQRKDLAEQKRKELEERNEARRKANEERRKNGDKKTDDNVAKANEKPVDNNKTNQPTVEAKPKEKNKSGIVKTGTNATPVFKDEDLKKYKDKGKPKSYFLKHRPCYQEAVVWLARTHIERGNYDEAELLLGDLEKDSKTFKDIKTMAAIAHAQMYIKQQSYAAAATMLEKTIKLSRKKRDKARLAYVLAQVYQQLGNNEKAFATFDKVLDYSPVYEMEFNARLNMALNSTTNTESTTSVLNKMAKDAKNIEYRDQIYFTLAQIDLKSNNKAEAIKHLKESLDAQGRNPQQKAEAYYLLAKLQFENEVFVESKNYFDSTSMVMAKNDSRMPEVSRYASNLRDIANNIEIITLQDSLLKIAAMSDKEKKALATNIKKARLAEAANAQNQSSGGGSKLKNELDINNPSVANGAQSSFFGYYVDIVKKGKREFEKKWGTDRKLEDNWRRSNKKGGDGEAKYTFDDSNKDITDREVAEILKDVPKETHDIEIAKYKVDDAMFQLGTLFHDKLKNDKKCVETLEKHLTRFPQTKHELDDWYYLYTAYTDLGNKAKAQEYFDKILNKYPNSNYANILKNTGIAVNKDSLTVEKYYLITYDMFKKGDAKKASERIAASETTFGINNPLKAKFALLNALCVGKLMGKDEYIKALKDVVAKFVGTPEEKYAKEILRIVESGLNPQTSTPSTEGGTAIDGFKLDDDKLHYVMIALPQNTNTEDAKIAVSDYNSAYHRLDNLSISTINLSADTEIPILVLRRFKNKTEALKYTEGVAKNTKDFLKMKYEIFAVTQDNYREILKQKSFDSYRGFYQKYYSK